MRAECLVRTKRLDLCRQIEMTGASRTLPPRLVALGSFRTLVRILHGHQVPNLGERGRRFALPRDRLGGIVQGPLDRRENVFLGGSSQVGLIETMHLAFEIFDLSSQGCDECLVLLVSLPQPSPRRGGMSRTETGGIRKGAPRKKWEGGLSELACPGCITNRVLVSQSSPTLIFFRGAITGLTNAYKLSITRKEQHVLSDPS